ncbi:MAG: hypothetical protein HKO66_11810 [Saprospiraceae bacterium]|nr:SRPBCC family protein [Bacteroidia bacterium]NNE13603.1 hypothetical protein [Saprospiraceae bacterium]NNL92914.1 hypothetical protein [Saprospiraceae bacterium]
MNKLIKYFIYFLLIILALFLLVNFIAPKNLNLEVSEEMDAPPNLIYNLVNDLKKWEDWSPWTKLDTNVVQTFSDNTSGVGAYVAWKGNTAIGEGRQTIKESVSGEKIKFAMDFKGVDGLAYSNWKFNKEGNLTNVSWDFKGSDTPFAFRFFNLIMKGSLVKNYKEGLQNLKNLSEKRANDKIYNGYKINEIVMPEKHFILNRAKVKIDNIQQFYASNLGALFGKVTGKNVEMDGMPCGLFFKWDQEKGMTDMAASIPVKEPISIKGVGSQTIPSSRAIQVDFYGDYSKLSNAHNAIDDYMKDYDILNDPPIIEEYVTDPTVEQDPSKWLTKITYYIAEN